MNPTLPDPEDEGGWLSWLSWPGAAQACGDPVANLGGEPVRAGDVTGHQPGRDAAVLEARATPGASIVQGSDAGYDVRSTNVDFRRNDLVVQGMDVETRIPGTDSFSGTHSGLVLDDDGDTFVTSDGFEVVSNEQGASVTKDAAPVQDWVEHFGAGLEGVSDENLEHAFGVAMRDHLFGRLDAAEAGVQSQARDPEQATRSAKALLDAEEAHRHALALVEVDTVIETGAGTQVRRNAAQERAADEAYARARELAIASYPMLRGMDDAQLAALVGGDEAERDEAIHAEKQEVLADIASSRKNLRDGSLDPWASENAVTGALDALGFAADDPRRQQLLDVHADAKRWDTFTSLGLTAVGTALAVGGLAEPGVVGESAGAAMIAAGLSVGALDAALESEAYHTDSAAFGAGGGSADLSGLVGEEEMRGRELMLALAWSGLAVDAAGIGKAAHLLAEGADLGKAAKLVGVPEADLASGMEQARRAYAHPQALAARDRHLADLTPEQRARVGVGVVPAEGDILGGNRGAFQMFDGRGHVLLREDATIADEITEFAHAKDFAEGQHADDFALLDDATLQAFADAPPARKLELHGARVRIEESGQERALEELSGALVRCEDPDEAVLLENAIADTARSLDAIRVQGAELDAAKQTGELPGFVDQTPTLHRTSPEATQFDAMPKPERTANHARVEAAYRDQPATDASREALLKEGYVERTLADGRRIMARPSGANDALPPLREENGQWVIGPHVQHYDPLAAGSSVGEAHAYLQQSASWKALEESLLEMKMREPGRAGQLEGLGGEELVARRAALEQEARAEVAAQVQARLGGTPHFTDGQTGRGVGMDTLRHEMKESFKVDMLRHLDEVSKADPAKGHEALLAITAKMNPSDKGNFTETWYQDVFLRLPRDEAGNPVGWAKHVQMPQVGDQARFADMVTPTAIHEVKSGKALTDKDFAQFEDYMAALRSGEMTQTKIEYVITDPHAASLSHERLRRMFDLDPEGERLVVTVFDAKGRPHVLNSQAEFEAHPNPEMK